VDDFVELINTKKIKEPEFCNLCEKDRKHLLLTYQDVNENNEPYTFEMKKCKSCGCETNF
jgi:hypothetical protein